MKLSTHHATSLIQGQVESVDMTLSAKGIIAATKMFRDQIYTHKAWAVVREIICNAIDEHKKHGIAKPIQITLPTADDLHFRVRDYGQGLSKEGVFSVFFQYFASTKDQDNDAIGGFGIGAKSPLAYADIFYVDSYHGGSKTTYVATVNGEASQAHKIALQDSNETGIEVSVPVEASDISKFRELVQYFVDNAKFDNFTFVGGDIVKKDIPWTVNNKFGRVGNVPQLFKSGSNIFAQIGDVLYPIDSTPEIRNPFYQVAVVELENGAVDIHPSRERLELSKRNIFLINKALVDLCNEATAEFTTAMKAAQTAAEKFKVKGLGGMFRNTPANVAQVMPAKLSINKNDHATIAWDKTNATRGDLKIYMGRCGYNYEIAPFGQNGGGHNTLNTAVPHSIILTGDDPIRLFDVIAYAESNKIPAPVLCVKSGKVPQGWVVGKDVWVYAEPTKDETKAVRSRYVVSTAGTKKAVAKLAGDTVLGYTSRTRSYHGQITPNRMQAGIQYVLCPFEGNGYVEHELANKLKMNVVFVYCYQSNLSNWKADKLPTGADFIELSKFAAILKAEAQKTLTANVIPQPTNGLELEHGQVLGGNKYAINDSTIDLVDKLKVAFPDLKAAKTNPLWDAAQKVWDSLSASDKELALFYEDRHYSFQAYPLMTAQAKAIWAKVFP